MPATQPDPLVSLDALLLELRAAREQLAQQSDDLRHWRELAQRYQASFDLSASGQAFAALDGRLEEVNARLCEITGFSRAELLGRRFHDITHPDDLALDLTRVQELLAGERSSFRIEKRYLRRDGQPVWTLLTVALIRDADGRPTHLAGVIEDISERKQAETRLHERDVLLSSLSRNVPGVIHKLVFGTDGQVSMHYVSDAASEMFELDAARRLDFTAYQERVHPQDLAYFQRLAHPSSGRQPQPVHYEYRAVLPTRGLRWYGGRAVPELEPDGTLAWYGYTSDITEQKLYQEARVAAQAADSANRAKSEFLSRMSHELRTPLNAVIGFAQLLRLDTLAPLAAEQRTKVDLIEHAGSHLLAVISDVLDLSRIEAGSLPLCLEPLGLAGEIGRALELVEGDARRAQVHLVRPEIDPSLSVVADGVRLRQVFVNILSNAIKYNRSGGQVSVHATEQGDIVAIDISDTGRGMSMEQCSHLFEPFNRLGAERTQVEGTGIGLVIVRRLVELMHGRIHIASRTGLGTRVTLHLPPGGKRAVPASRPTEGPALLAQPDCALLVLYAEDNEINVLLVQQILALRPRCRLLVATNGAQAIELATQKRPDVVLLDMHLGDMTGFEVAEALDRDPRTARIPRVALSADAMPDRVHAARAQGFLTYLTKPLDVAALLRCLDELAARLSRP